MFVSLTFALPSSLSRVPHSPCTQCDACACAKRKCDGESRCSLCTKKGIPCVYSEVRRREIYLHGKVVCHILDPVCVCSFKTTAHCCIAGSPLRGARARFFVHGRREMYDTKRFCPVAHLENTKTQAPKNMLLPVFRTSYPSRK